MSKKNRNSAHAAKARRQAKALAVRREVRAPEHQKLTEEAFARSVSEGFFRVVCPDGKARDVTLERMHAHLEADLVPDGIEPFPDRETLIAYIGGDIEMDFLWLRSDGLWGTSQDYFTDRQVTS